MHRQCFRCFVCVAILGVACATHVSAQTGSLREGYVIVTPTFGDQSRLSAFETFRFRGSSGSSQATVLDSTLSTNASVFVTSDNLSARDSAFAFVNPAGTDAQLTLTLFRAGGSAADVQRLTIPAGRQMTFFITELFPRNAELQTGFSGLVNVISSNPVGIVGLRFQTTDFSTVPIIQNLPVVPTVPPQPNGAGGPGALLFPQFATGSGWNTEIVLANTSIGPITVRVDVFDNNGVPMQGLLGGNTGQVTISPSGVMVLSTGVR